MREVLNHVSSRTNVNKIGQKEAYATLSRSGQSCKAVALAGLSDGVPVYAFMKDNIANWAASTDAEVS